MCEKERREGGGVGGGGGGLCKPSWKSGGFGGAKIGKYFTKIFFG